MHSFNYKGGTVTVQHAASLDPYVTAYRHGVRLYEGKSEAAAKAALTRYHKQWLAERNAEHHRAIVEIWKGPAGSNGGNQCSH